MDFFELIMQLEDELSDRKNSIFSKKVDVDKCQSLVGELRRCFPEVIKEAALIVGEREKYLSEAKSIYDNTVQEADRQAEKILSQTAIFRRAEEEARHLMELTENRCNQLVLNTKNHLDMTFENIEKFLLNALKMIQNNRKELREAQITSFKPEDKN